MSLKRKHKIIIGILLALAVILVSVNAVVSGIVDKRFQDLITKQKVENYHLSLNKTRFNLFDRSLELSGISIIPKDSAMFLLNRGRSSESSLHQIEIKRIKLSGIQLLPLLLSKKIHINRLLIDLPNYKKFDYPKSRVNVADSSGLDIDSIRINHFGGLRINKISVKDLTTKIIDLKSDQVRFENNPFKFDITGFQLIEIDKNLFRLKPVGEVFEISKIKMKFPKRKYEFSINKVRYHYEKDQLNIQKLSFKPTINKAVLASTYRFNDEVYILSIKDLMLSNLDVSNLVEHGGVVMDSLNIDGFNIEIYKDKRKPFNENKRPEFPHNAIKNLKDSLLIPQISIINSQLIYEERLKNKEILMRVTMEDIDAKITNVTNLPSYFKQPMKINMASKFMGKANLDVQMTLPVDPNNNTFYFSGYLGKSKLRYYDSAIVPALGLKVLKGEIESLSFQASADNNTSSGSMRMLYYDLETKVFKSESTEKNEFLSWSVNNLVHKSNPGLNGKVREASMRFERVKYKGFGNFLWKTLQSGIINTIAPFGLSEQKANKKEMRKKKRQDKKKNKRN